LGAGVGCKLNTYMYKLAKCVCVCVCNKPATGSFSAGHTMVFMCVETILEGGGTRYISYTGNIHSLSLVRQPFYLVYQGRRALSCHAKSHQYSDSR
jgi:hypothetical protein